MRVVVLTSNDYVKCLPAFAYCLNKHWQPAPDVTVVRYEIRPPKLPPNFHNWAIGRQGDHSWSSGLRYFLERIEESTVLLLLEDYLLCANVDAARIEELDKRARVKGVVKIDLSGDALKREHTVLEDGLVQAHPESGYLASLQAAIWKRKALIDLLLDENPWQFEKHASRRMTGRVLGVSEPALRYVNGVGGEGNLPGRWDRRKFPPAMWDELLTKGLVWYG